MKEYSMKDWSESYKSPMTKDYQPSEKEFAGMQGNTLSYMERKERMQEKEASKIRSQKYHGRYE